MGIMLLLPIVELNDVDRISGFIAQPDKPMPHPVFTRLFIAQ